MHFFYSINLTVSMCVQMSVFITRMKHTTINKEPIQAIHAKKRSVAQRAADLEFTECHVLRGRTQAEIAELLTAARPYRVSRSQISYDIDTLKTRWLDAAGEAFAAARARSLRTLALAEREAWEHFDRSRKQDSGAGNPAFLRTILEIHDRRTKLLGLDAPVRQELTGADGGPLQIETNDLHTRLTPEAKRELFLRHMARLREDEAAATEKTAPNEN
jgi:hypothetical protein